MATEVTFGLETASIAPLRITVKSARHEYQLAEPKQGPSTALTHGVSRRRQYCWASWPPPAMLPAPIASCMRWPDDSPRKISGMPLRVAHSFM
ncbi:hypothetical protein D3C75_1118810 [compost metagenome]